jgi:chitodextrinase
VATTIYQPPDVASKNGKKYSAQHWTQGDDPEQKNGVGMPWSLPMPCP